jgi:hypothetical protein
VFLQVVSKCSEKRFFTQAGLLLPLRFFVEHFTMAKTSQAPARIGNLTALEV